MALDTDSYIELCFVELRRDRAFRAYVEQRVAQIRVMVPALAAASLSTVLATPVGADQRSLAQLLLDRYHDSSSQPQWLRLRELESSTG